MPTAAQPNQDLSDGLRRFQQEAQIPATGQYDPATAQAMEEPRCGSEMGYGWLPNGGTWPDVDVWYRWSGFINNVTRPEQRLPIQTAFNEWGRVSSLTFQLIDSNLTSEIDCSYMAMDGPRHIFASASRPPPRWSYPFRQCGVVGQIFAPDGGFA